MEAAPFTPPFSTLCLQPGSWLFSCSTLMTFRQEFFADYPGFDALKTVIHTNVGQETIRVKLTQSLGKLTSNPML